jgi:hypothetical protein
MEDVRGGRSIMLDPMQGMRKNPGHENARSSTRKRGRELANPSFGGGHSGPVCGELVGSLVVRGPQMIINPKTADNIGRFGLQTEMGRDKACERRRAGDNAAFVASEPHALLILDGSLRLFGGLDGQHQGLFLVLVLDVQTEIIHKQRGLHQRRDGRNAEQGRTEGQPELVGSRGAARCDASGGKNWIRHSRLILKPSGPVVGNKTGRKEVQGIFSLASRLHQVSMRHMLESLLQIKHDVNAVRLVALQGGPHLVSPSGVPCPPPSGVGTEGAFGMAGSPCRSQGRPGPTIEPVQAAKECNGTEAPVLFRNEDNHELGLLRRPAT